MRNWTHDGRLPDATHADEAFLFLIGIILNQNISGELAWRGVAQLSERLDLHPQNLVRLSREEIESTLRQPPAIHPFTTVMARAIAEAADRICRDYSADARHVWRTALSPSEVIERLTRFRQVGRHKAEIAVFLLTSVYGELTTSVPIDIGRSCPALLSYLSG
jgi:uncharacterized HhH-GPD family protein